jgi:hypothetical protein
MQWSPIRHAESFPVTDPYFHWRLGAGITRSDANPVRPVVVRLEKGKTARDLAGWARTAADESALCVPCFYTDATEGLEDARWCTGLAKAEFFELLETDEARELISRVAVLSEIAPSDEYADQSTDGQLGRGEHCTVWPGDSVVIGIIDFGFAFAHERFRLTETTTRLEYLWVQDAPPAQGETASSPVPYGHEITAGTINGWLAERGGRADEDVLYRQAAGLLGRRWLRSVSRRMAHGTHVLDLASGYRLDERPDSIERRQRPIICVQLPEAAVADTSGASLDSYVLDGIRYILERADEIASHANLPPLPVVINFSSGEVAGPHDGTSDLEQAIDELIELRSKIAPLEVVISAGNSHLGRLHAQVKFESLGQPVDLPWRVLPDDRTPSFLEIWLPDRQRPDNGSRIKLKIRPPGEESESSEWLDESRSGAGAQYASGEDVLCEMRYRYVGDPTNRGMFLIAVQPTRRDEPTPSGAAAHAVAPSGTWTVTLENTGFDDEEPTEAWLQWDDVPLGFPRRGRQSYFDEKCYRRLDAQGREIEEDTHPEQLASPCHVKRAGSMNAIATGRRTIVVGASLGDEVRPAKYSAGGPITRAVGSPKPNRDGPDVMAVSDDSIIHLGILAAGTRSGSVVVMSGTSVAAPQVTREVALVLATSSPGQAGVRVDDQPSGRDEIVGRLTIVSHVRGSQQRSGAAPDHGPPNKERTGVGCVKTERPPGVSTRGGVRRFEKREQADSGDSLTGSEVDLGP